MLCQATKRAGSLLLLSPFRTLLHPLESYGSSPVEWRMTAEAPMAVGLSADAGGIVSFQRPRNELRGNPSFKRPYPVQHVACTMWLAGYFHRLRDECLTNRCHMPDIWRGKQSFVGISALKKGEAARD